MGTLITVALGYILGISTPYLKKLAQQIIAGAYQKSKAEIERWFK
jgi:hypothetical protein